MIMTAADNLTRYRIYVPAGCSVRIGPPDVLYVPHPDDPNGPPLPLFDELLIWAARDGDFGLELLSEIRLG